MYLSVLSHAVADASVGYLAEGNPMISRSSSAWQRSDSSVRRVIASILTFEELVAPRDDAEEHTVVEAQERGPAAATRSWRFHGHYTAKALMLRGWECVPVSLP